MLGVHVYGVRPGWHLHTTHCHHTVRRHRQRSRAPYGGHRRLHAARSQLCCCPIAYSLACGSNVDGLQQGQYSRHLSSHPVSLTNPEKVRSQAHRALPGVTRTSAVPLWPVNVVLCPWRLHVVLQVVEGLNQLRLCTIARDDDIPLIMNELRSLERGLKQMNVSQGLGFILYGQVINVRFLTKIFVQVSTLLVAASPILFEFAATLGNERMEDIAVANATLASGPRPSLGAGSGGGPR